MLGIIIIFVGTTSPTSGGCSIGIVLSRTKATEFSFSLVVVVVVILLLFYLFSDAFNTAFREMLIANNEFAEMWKEVAVA
jgi:hypothetical protein